MTKPLQFISAGATHVGMKRSRNEDSMLTVRGRDATVWGVFDGMGGHGGGDVASQTAHRTVKTELAGGYVDAGLCESALLRAHEAVSALGRIGTTGTLLWLGNRSGVANTGDSRAYQIRSGVLTHLTFDHNGQWRNRYQYGMAPKTREQVNAKKDTALSNCLGGVQAGTPVIETMALAPQRGDVYLVFTDGLNAMVSDYRILNIVQKERIPDRIVTALIDAALRAGGVDNVTVNAVLVT